MRETRQSGSEGGGAKPIVSPYPYFIARLRRLKLALEALRLSTLLINPPTLSFIHLQSDQRRQ